MIERTDAVAKVMLVADPFHLNALLLQISIKERMIIDSAELEPRRNALMSQVVEWAQRNHVDFRWEKKCGRNSPGHFYRIRPGQNPEPALLAKLDREFMRLVNFAIGMEGA